MTNGWIRSLGRMALGLAAVLMLPKAAMAITPVPAPPIFVTTDANGVDPARKTFTVSRTDLSIGPSDPQGMSFGRFWMGSTGWRDTLAVTLSGTLTNPIVSYGGKSYTFYRNNVGSTYLYSSDQYDSYTLVKIAGGYTFTMRGGTVVNFINTGGSYDRFVSNLGWAESIVFPNGTRWDFHYRTQQYCDTPLNGSGNCTTTTSKSVRLQSVTNNFGYQLKLSYVGNTLADINALDAWNNLTQVTAINNAVESCTPTADSCSLVNSWPSVSYASTTTSGITTETVTDALSGVWRYTIQSGRITGIKRPTASSDNVTIGYDGSGLVQSITSASILMNYAWSDVTTHRTMTVTGPSSTQRSSVAGITTGKLEETADALARVTEYRMTNTGEMLRVDDPRPFTPVASINSRGNITQQGVGSALTSYTFPSSCSNSKTCDQPSRIDNPYGEFTTPQYDATHGGVVYVEGFAPFGTDRPAQRFAYGSISSSFTGGGTIYLQNLAGSCQTQDSSGSYGCTNIADEVKTTTTYGSSSVNYLPTSVTVGAGDGSGTQATTAMTYDNVGNSLTVDGPLSGTADTTRTRYDALRRVVGLISADPDGGSSMKHRATRTTYNADSQVTLVEQGTVDSQSDGDWAAMTVLQSTTTTYDNDGRAVKSEFTTGGTTRSVTQYSYDATGRLECTAVRMNSAVFGALPASACTLGTTGSEGPDRITRLTYDTSGAVLKTQKAYGTALQQDYITNSYDAATGELIKVVDANGNETKYEYDNNGDIEKTTYANPATGVANGTTEINGYDVARKRITLTKRNGEIVAFSRNTNGSLAETSYPNGSITSKKAYKYDLLGRTTRDKMTGGLTAQNDYSYDVFGRVTSILTSRGTTPLTWTKSMQYDAAGRRTRLTWDDGFYVTYDYDVVGELTAIKENGSTTLVSFAYDDLGRRTSMTRGNSTSVSYSYDTSSRVSQILDDLDGSSADQTTTFSYNVANQITQLAKTNDSYAWTQHYNVNRNYSVDRLNRYSAAGSVTTTYSEGRLTSAGAATYSYDAVDHLVGATGGHVFRYDSSDRLAASVSAGEQYDYDGPNLVTEHDYTTGAILRRYVHEFGDDKPLVWYEGSGTGNKRWLSSDERGSVTAITDGTGAVVNINSYDSWGIPQSTNLGRFQYTGQTWMPELGMYNYKARIYSPTLGRFLQTDPIGYGDGINWYAYVGNDPVNSRDPSGKFDEDPILIGVSPSSCTLCNGIMVINPDAGLITLTSNLSSGDYNWLSTPFSGGLGVMDAYAATFGLGDLATANYGAASIPLQAMCGRNPSACLYAATSTGAPGSFINPFAHIKFGPNFFDHVKARHLATSSGNGSKFLPRWSTSTGLETLILLGVARAIPTGPPGVFTYTATAEVPVGRLSDGSLTFTYTIQGFVSGIASDGKPNYSVTNMYPGLP